MTAHAGRRARVETFPIVLLVLAQLRKLAFATDKPLLARHELLCLGALFRIDDFLHRFHAAAASHERALTRATGLAVSIIALPTLRPVATVRRCWSVDRRAHACPVAAGLAALAMRRLPHRCADRSLGGKRQSQSSRDCVGRSIAIDGRD